MGQLFYGNSSQPVIIPDRQLAHLKMIVTTKLRRNESFTLSWRHVDDSPGGRTTVWLQPSIPLQFVFDSAVGESLDSAILREYAEQASSSAGLTLDLSADLQADLDKLAALPSRATQAA
ncbi:hypothetical protein QL996_05250 [Planococcus sp. APC 4015]|nr:hypothetical protein [Planococcus sp. APC 4015]